jgi:hypothetical protein
MRNQFVPGFVHTDLDHFRLATVCRLPTAQCALCPRMVRLPTLYDEQDYANLRRVSLICQFGREA